MVKVSFTVRIDKELHDRLEEKARELGTSKTKLVEKIIADHFQYRLKDDVLEPLEKIVLELQGLKARVDKLESIIFRQSTKGIDRFMRGK